jgi:hypothetical protein
MKKPLLLVVLSLVLVAPAAGAAGANLSWENACWGDVGSANLLQWACNSNTYAGIRMTCSFRVEEARGNLYSAAVFLSGWTEGTSIPDWWRMNNLNPTDCRHNAITTLADQTVLSQPEDGGVCRSPFGGDVPAGGIGLYSWDGNRMSVNAAWGGPGPYELEADVEYFLCQFRISAMKTVNGCAGCQVAALWGLDHVELAVGAGSEYVYANPFEDNPYLFWQAELPTVARYITWGRIKGLYR